MLRTGQRVGQHRPTSRQAAWSAQQQNAQTAPVLVPVCPHQQQRLCCDQLRQIWRRQCALLKAQAAGIVQKHFGVDGCLLCKAAEGRKGGSQIGRETAGWTKLWTVADQLRQHTLQCLAPQHNTTTANTRVHRHSIDLYPGAHPFSRPGRGRQRPAGGDRPPASRSRCAGRTCASRWRLCPPLAGAAAARPPPPHCAPPAACLHLMQGEGASSTTGRTAETHSRDARASSVQGYCGGAETAKQPGDHNKATVHAMKWACRSEICRSLRPAALSPACACRSC